MGGITKDISPRYRSLAYGAWRYARDYLEAARLVRDAQRGTLRTVRDYLLGHSIELSLKAYLTERGYPESELRRIGHDLEKALAAAKAEGIEKVVALTRDDQALIECLNPTYRDKDFEYLRVGVKEIPEDRFTEELAAKLVDQLAGVARRAAALKTT